MASLSPSEARPEVLAPVSPSEARSEGLAPVSSPEAGPEGLNTAVLASANLVGAAEAWVSSPEWMDFLWDESPARRVKLLERELYLRLWCDLIPPGVRVLDVGGGTGAFLAAAGARTAISERFAIAPADSANSGLGVTIPVVGKLSAASVTDAGLIVVEGSTAAASTGQAITIILTPTFDVANGTITWACAGTPARYMPGSCRNEFIAPSVESPPPEPPLELPPLQEV